MLIRNMQNLYEADASEGTPAVIPTPATVQGNKTGETNGDGEKKKPEPITMTSGQLKKRLEDAKALERKAFLEGLGITDEGALKALVENARKAEDAQKSEAQKANEALTKLQADLEAANKRNAELSNAQKAQLRDSELKALLTEAHNPSQLLILLKAQYADKLDALLNEDGSFNTESAKALIADYRKENAFMFQDKRQGSAMSNKDGRVPNPERDKRKQMSEKLGKTVRGF